MNWNSHVYAITLIRGTPKQFLPYVVYLCDLMYVDSTFLQVRNSMTLANQQTHYNV